MGRGGIRRDWRIQKQLAYVAISESCKVFGFCSKCNGVFWEKLKLGSVMVWFMFLKDHVTMWKMDIKELK